MSDLYDRVKAGVDALIEQFQEASKDGLEFGEVLALVTSAVGHITGLVTQVVGYDSKERREAVLQAAERFVDEVIVPIDFKNIPDWMEPMFDNALKPIVMMAVNAVLDTIAKILGKDVIEPAPDDPSPEIDDGRIMALCRQPDGVFACPCDPDCDCDGKPKPVWEPGKPFPWRR